MNAIEGQQTDRVENTAIKSIAKAYQQNQQALMNNSTSVNWFFTHSFMDELNLKSYNNEGNLKYRVKTPEVSVKVITNVTFNTKNLLKFNKGKR